LLGAGDGGISIIYIIYFLELPKINLEILECRGRIELLNQWECGSFEQSISLAEIMVILLDN
jgi:hypothetical protein